MKLFLRMFALILCLILLCSATLAARAEAQRDGEPSESTRPSVMVFSNNGTLEVTTWGSSDNDYPVFLAIYNGTTGQLLHIGRNRAEQDEVLCRMELDYFSLPRELLIRAFWVKPDTMQPASPVTERYLILAEDLEDLKAEIHKTLDRLDTREIHYHVPYATLGDTETDAIFAHIKKHPNHMLFTPTADTMGASAYSIRYQIHDPDIADAMAKWQDKTQELSTQRAQEMYDAMTAAYEAIWDVVTTENEYDLVRAIYEYLCIHAEYDFETFCGLSDSAADLSYNPAYDAYGALVKQLCVCQGYAETFDLLCWMFDIPCCIAVSSEMNHAWNLVQMEGNWYHVDVTWGDGDNGQVYDSQFLMSDAVFARSHIWGKDIPGCSIRGWDGDFIEAPKCYMPEIDLVESEYTVILNEAETLIAAKREELESTLTCTVELSVPPEKKDMYLKAIQMTANWMRDGWDFDYYRTTYNEKSETLSLTVGYYVESPTEIPEDVLQLQSKEHYASYVNELIAEGGGSIFLPIPEGKASEVYSLMVDHQHELFGDAKISFSYPSDTNHTLTVHVFNEDKAVSVSTPEAAVEYLKQQIENEGRTRTVVFRVPEGQENDVIDALRIAAHNDLLFGGRDEIRISFSGYQGESGLVYVAATDLTAEMAVLDENLLNWYLDQTKKLLTAGSDSFSLPMPACRECIYGDAIQQKIDDGYFGQTNVNAYATYGSGECWIY